MATGLMLICTGKMTTQIDAFSGLDKEYTDALVLGATTPSYDSETEKDGIFSTEHITEKLVRATALQFIGALEQIPPQYSAIKVDGSASYIKARKGEKVEMKARRITINSFEITRIEIPEIDFEVSCSKGTYIRSLAYDLGRALNSGAYLTALRRTKIGNYHINDAWGLDKLIEEILQ